MKPITLMKLSQINDPDELLEKIDKSNLLVSKKLDGWLTQAIKSGGDWHIYTRRGQDVTDNMPKMVSALNNLGAPDNTFLLGEMVAKKDGKDNIGEIQSVMGASAEKGAEEEKGKDITFYVFDILWKGGTKVADKPFSERLKTLGSVVKDSGSVKKVPNKPFSSWQSVMAEATKTGGEGIVLKDTTKPYAYKVALGSSEPKPGYWYKYKGKVGGKEGKEDSDDYVVYDHTIGDKGKDKFKFGQYYKGKLYGISEISNLSKEDASKLKGALSSGKKPVIEIGFQERVPGGLRHQKFIRHRDDKSSKNATMHEFHAKNIDKFKTADGKEQNADDDALITKLRGMIEPEVIDAGDSWEFQLFLEDVPITPRQTISKVQLRDFIISMKELGEIALQDVERGHYDEEIMKVYEERPETFKVATISKRADFTINDTGFGNMIYNYADDEDYLTIGHGRDSEIWWLEGNKIIYKDGERYAHCNFEESMNSSVSGRIDHEHKKISIVSGGNDRIEKKIINIFWKKFPDYKIYLYKRELRRPAEIFADDGGNYEIKKSKIQGYGAFATKDFSKGDVIGVGAVQINNSGVPDDDYKNTDFGRYINHADEPGRVSLFGKTKGKPNAINKRDGEKINIVAKDNIKSGDEILTDYRDYSKLIENKKATRYISKRAEINTKGTGVINVPDGFEEWPIAEQAEQIYKFYFKHRHEEELLQDLLNYLIKREEPDFARFIYEVNKRIFALRTRIPQNKIDVGPLKFKVFWEREVDKPWDEKDAEDVKVIIDIVSNAARKVMRRGLGNALEDLGIYILMDQLDRSSAAAAYSLPTDKMMLPYQTVKKFKDDPKAIQFGFLHELGHRVYFRFMSERARNEWENRYESKIISFDNAGEFYEKYIRPYTGGVLNLDNLRMEVATDPELNDVERAKYEKILTHFEGVSEIPLYNIAQVHKLMEFLQKIYTPIGSEMIGEEITRYGASNPKEAFAEAFAHYVNFGPNILGDWTRNFLENVVRSGGRVQLAEDEEEDELRSVAMALSPKPAVYDGAGDLSYEDRGRQWADDEDYDEIEGISQEYFDIGHRGRGNIVFVYKDGRLTTWKAKPGVHAEHFDYPDVDVYAGRIGKDKISIRPRTRKVEVNRTRDLESLYRLLSRRYPDHDIIYFPWYKKGIPIEKWFYQEQAAEDSKGIHEKMDGGFSQKSDDDYTPKMYTSIGHAGSGSLLWWFKDGKVIIRPITDSLSKHSEYYIKEGYEREPRHQGRIDEGNRQISFSSLEHNIRLEKKIAEYLHNKYPEFEIVYFGPDLNERGIAIDNYLYEQDAKDFEEKEHDWDEVLIDKEKKLTRGQIRDHYNKVKSKLFPYVKDRKVVIYIGTGTNQNVLKRNENDKPIIIKSIEGDTPSALDYWIKRRMLEIHPTVSSSDDVVWVDLDPHGDFSLDETKKWADKIAPIIKKEFGGKVEKWFSGSKGIHVVGYLKDKIDIDKARNTLKSEMDKLAEDSESVTTGIVKGNGLRLDTTTLKNTGSIRAPYSLALGTGKEKKQLGSTKEAKMKFIAKRQKRISKRAEEGGSRSVGRGKGETAPSGHGAEWTDDPYAFYWKDPEGPFGKRTVETILRFSWASEMGSGPVISDIPVVGNGLENLRKKLLEILDEEVDYMFYETDKAINVSLVEKRIDQVPIEDEEGNVKDYRAKEELIDSYQHGIYLRLPGRRRQIELIAGDARNPVAKYNIDESYNANRAFVERVTHSLNPVRG